MIILYLFLIGVLGYLLNKYYFSGGKYESEQRLDGKICIITGASCGIGYETALNLASRGARLILACRDEKKAEKAADKIRRLSGNSKVEVEYLDLSDLETIRSFAKKMNSKLSKLDLLINNAAVMGCPLWRTKQGFEMQFGVNYLGHFLLTNLLLNLLKSTENSRIISVASIAHYGLSLNWNDLNCELNYNTIFSYGRSKLALILFTKELARRLQGTSCTAVSLHPGVVRTEIMRYTNLGWFRYMDLLMKLFYFCFLVISKSAYEGSMTTVYCALDKEIIKHNGCYFSDCKLKTPHKNAHNMDHAAKLWETSSKLVNL